MKAFQYGCILVSTAFICNILIANSPLKQEEKIWITTDNSASQMILEQITSAKEYNSFRGTNLIAIDSQDLLEVSRLMHLHFRRCGGFFAHSSFEKGNETLFFSENQKGIKRKDVDYSMTMGSTVSALIDKVLEGNVKQTILHLSSYKTRYYKSKTGIESQKWLHQKWKTITKKRDDIKVELISHQGFEQSSVMITFQTDSIEEVVIGAHGDSIVPILPNFFKAPGADDDASGIATITEALRVLVEGNFYPDKTVHFISYAAEEVGLKGSKSIVEQFKNRRAQVAGVLNLDMTNYQGSKVDIVLMTDYTNEAQNKFIGELIDRYIKVKWDYDECGYACSDHASWTDKGYPASMPFESYKREINPNFHSKKDDISKSGGHAKHAVKFVKLVLAYVVELAKGQQIDP